MLDRNGNPLPRWQLSGVYSSAEDREQVARAVREVKLDGLTGRIEFDSKGDRKLSDYYIVSMREARYPGDVLRVIQFAPPAARQ